MIVALINGSPKVKDSNSGVLLDILKGYIDNKATIVEVGLHKRSISKDNIEKLKQADVWVIACPLYVDGLPGHLLSCLIQLEEDKIIDRQINVYGVINCGYYEGNQTEIALDIIKNWCEKIGYVWICGVGIGGGGSINMLPRVPDYKGPLGMVEYELSLLAQTILNCKNTENKYVSVGFPRFLYKMLAQMGWRKDIKNNGLKKKDLSRRIQ